MKRDPNQMSLFDGPLSGGRVFPVRAETGPLQLDRFRSEVKRAMAEAIRQSGHDRPTIALRMAQYLGLEGLSKTTLDAYTAESKGAHDISLLRFAAFVHATRAPWLYDLIASKAGLTVLDGHEARLAEIALLDQERRRIASDLRKLRATPVQTASWRRAGRVRP